MRSAVVVMFINLVRGSRKRAPIRVWRAAGEEDNIGTGKNLNLEKSTTGNK